MYIADFEVLSFFVLFFMAIYMRVKYSMETEQNRNFVRLVMVMTLADATDVLAAWAINYSWPQALALALNTAFFFFSVHLSYIFLYYCASYFYKAGTPKSVFLKISGFLNWIYIALLLVNIPTGILFRIADDASYTRGPLYPVILLLPAFYMVGTVIFILRHRASYTRFQRIMLLLFCLITLVNPVMQAMFYSGYLTNMYLATIMVFLVLLTMETPDDQELSATIEGLDRLKDELEQQVEEDTRTLRSTEQQLSNLTLQLSYAMTSAIDAKDRYTSGHSARVASYSRMLAGRLGMDDEKKEEIYIMGLLHDVGKIGVSNKIINKPGKLTDEEYAAMKQHPVIGYKILSKITLLPEISTGARWHHERPDGRGYPDGLTAGEIPYEAQIIAVADAYDAMTSYRSYRGVMPQEAVREQVEKGKGTQFNPEIADCMLQLIDEDTEYRMHELPHTEGTANETESV